MKKIVLVFTTTFFIISGLPAHDYKNFSFSADPVTFLVLLLGDESGDNETDLRNLWFSVDVNWETTNQKEMSFGVFLRADMVNIKMQYRTFFNKERQSGIFWGFYGLVEWRSLYWLYDKNNELTIGWNFPFQSNNNVYHSFGVTGGVTAGFRIRAGDFGITPYVGLGIPLFFRFGDLPPKSGRQELLILDITLRAIDIGLKLDFFQ